jgi:glycosyltransferase involved in cell wall biosynthesis
MHVTLVGGFYRAQPSPGGVRGYVESLEHYLDSVSVPRLTIVAGAASELGDRWCSIPLRRPGSTASLLASLCVNLRSLPIPQDTIIHAQRPDELLPFLLTRVPGTLVCTMHGNPFRGMMQGKRTGRAAYVAVEGVLLGQTARVIFVDAGTAAFYRSRYPWLTEKSDIIPNAVDTRVFHPMDRSDAKRKWEFSGTTLLFAGRLEPEKRVVDIVKAFRDFPQKRGALVIAGDGRERELVLREAAGLNVRLLGTVARSEMPSLLNAADAVVQYSMREGLPSTVLEALACGTPVIATAVGDIPDIIRDGENGRLVASKAGLTQAMRAVSTGELAASKSIPKVVQQYSWTEIGPRLLASYAEAQKIAIRGGQSR